MYVRFDPQLREGTLALSVAGDTLTVNGTVFDFSALPEGATLPSDAISSVYFSGDIERIDGELHVVVLLPHAADASEAARFPAPLRVTTDGPVEVPR